MTEAVLSHRQGSFWSAALALGLATLLTRATTFVTQTVIAHRFGVSAYTDAYFAVESILLLLSDFIVIGFGAAFIPLWMEYRAQQGKQEAQAFANALISVATGTTIILASIVALAAPVLVRLIAPGFSRQTAEIATQLLATVAPAVAFLGLTAGCTSLLEAHRRFVLPEISRAAHRAVILVATITLSDHLGVMALAWGTVAGSLAQLMAQLPNVLKMSFIHLTHQVDHEGVRRVGKLMLPVFVAHAGMRGTMLLGSMVASGLPAGAVAGLAYAGRVMLLPVGLVALPLRTTLFPTLSQHVAKDQLEAMGEIAIRGLRLLSFFTVPICAGLVLLRVPLIQLLFQRGAFDSVATQVTASTLGWYALSLPAIGGILVVNSIYFSLGAPTTLVKFNLINWAACVGLSLALVRRLGSGGIALSISLSTTITYGLAILTLKHELPTLKIRPLGEAILKASIAAALMAGLLLGLWALPVRIFHDLGSTMHSLIAVLGGAVVGGSIYSLAALALRTKEALVLVQSISHWATRRVK
jgi:putative peptidoglycan lipid II flippase